jgi:hypothetical protein
VNANYNIYKKTAAFQAFQPFLERILSSLSRLSRLSRLSSFPAFSFSQPYHRLSGFPGFPGFRSRLFSFFQVMAPCLINRLRHAALHAAVIYYFEIILYILQIINIDFR